METIVVTDETTPPTGLLRQDTLDECTLHVKRTANHHPRCLPCHTRTHTRTPPHPHPGLHPHMQQAHTHTLRAYTQQLKGCVCERKWPHQVTFLLLHFCTCPHVRAHAQLSVRRSCVQNMLEVSHIPLHKLLPIDLDML